MSHKDLGYFPVNDYSVVTFVNPKEKIGYVYDVMHLIEDLVIGISDRHFVFDEDKILKIVIGDYHLYPNENKLAVKTLNEFINEDELQLGLMFSLMDESVPISIPVQLSCIIANLKQCDIRELECFKKLYRSKSDSLPHIMNIKYAFEEKFTIPTEKQSIKNNLSEVKYQWTFSF